MSTMKKLKDNAVNICLFATTAIAGLKAGQDLTKGNVGAALAEGGLAATAFAGTTKGGRRRLEDFLSEKDVSFADMQHQTDAGHSIGNPPPAPVLQTFPAKPFSRNSLKK